MRKINEECGVFGIFSDKTTDVVHPVYYGLYALQHRGQESCGIVVNDDGLFNSYKDTGLVNDVFSPEIMEKLGAGNMAIGHVRYGSSEQSGRVNAQPMVVNHVKGRMALAHNGSLINAQELREELEWQGSIFHTTSDTEVISYVITRERLKAGSIEDAVCRAMYHLEGAYSLVIMSPSKLIAVRDPNGFRPLCYGQTEDGSYIIASESCALDAINAKFIRDIEPGEVVVFRKDSVRSIKEHCGRVEPTPCIFEYVYFARPDSEIDGCSVQEARIRAGIALAKEQPVEADVVIGVPDSGLEAAVGYAQESGIPCRTGFIKNKYIGRTFIAPEQKKREELVRIKLNPVANTVRGKRVIMVDDSIVRGTTMAIVVKILREAGAKEVHLRIAAPPYVSPCYYGTDVDDKGNLLACNYSMDELKGLFGVDSIGYLSVESVKTVACQGRTYCTACFDEKYPTRVPVQVKKNRFEKKISENNEE